MLMQVIHAQTDQSDENVVASLIVNRMLNCGRELELSSAETVGRENAYKVTNKKTKVDENTAEGAAHLNNYENMGEDIEWEKNTAGFAASDVAAYGIIEGVFIKVGEKCIKCYRWKCKWVC
jgi:hypothetical protein